MFATTRTASRFSRANGARGLTSREPMTLDTIREYAPSVFAETKHDSRSDRFTYIPTSQIVEHLMGQGYGVFAVNQGGSRTEGKRDFTKHMVRFRQLSQVLQVGGTHNEIVLRNAHDGTSAYELMAGVFRLACSNGLIVSVSTIDSVKVRHTGNILTEVANGADRIAGQLPAISNRVADFQAIDLAPQEREIFARAALTAKYGTEEPPVSASQILSTRRADDRAPDLWTTLNTIQESLVRGGNHYRKETVDETTGRRRVQNRTTNPVNSVDGQTSINRAVWQLAEEMKRLKAS